jgi:hypothetical protein
MSPFTAIGSVLFLLAFGAFGALGLAVHKLGLLERSVQVGDVAVCVVLAAFGVFCAGLGWRIYRTREAVPPIQIEKAPPRRVTLSHGFAAAGGLLLILCVLVPQHWYPVALLFGGLVFLSISHILTPCEERLAKLRKARAWERLQ